MKKTLLFALSLLLPLLSFGQSHAVSSRPPWIMGEVPSWTVGELPIIDLQGNRMMVVFSQGTTTEAAEKGGETQVVSNLLSSAGVTISNTEKITIEEENTLISKNRRTKSYDTSKDSYSNKIVVNGQTFGRFCLLDKYIQYKGGRYYFAGLYLVADKNMSLASVPPITYGMDRGAWRSLIVPGWAQFYQGRTGPGVAFLASEAALVGTAAFFQNRVSINAQRINEATSIDLKKAYKARYDQNVLYRNIAIGASVAAYAYNAIDAFTSKKGKLYYTVAYGQGLLSLAPAPIVIPDTGDMGFGLACNITF